MTNSRMKSFNLTAALFAVVGSVAGADPASIAPRPPLGWNSFDSYGVYLHEQAAMENLEAMAKHLKPYGYEYFVIDNGWFGEYKLKPGTLYPLEKHASDVRLNEYGQVIPSKTYFAGGPQADCGSLPSARPEIRHPHDAGHSPQGL